VSKRLEIADLVDCKRRNRLLFAKNYNLSSAFRHVKRALRERRRVAAAVISGSVVSAVCSMR